MTNLSQSAEKQFISQLPVKRAAYSDRMAVLMAEMSRLAYIPFEQREESAIDEIIQAIRGAASNEEARSNLANLKLRPSDDDRTHAKNTLKLRLAGINFELEKTYAVGDTQAFLAKRAPFAAEKRVEPGIIILSFRGTEATNVKDWQTNVNARKTMARGVPVHAGFWEAFKLVQARIEADIAPLIDSGHVLYVTGHSLGGALALIATRELGNDSTGACYTFGQPRVSTYGFARRIKTPIYRVVNASDIVPRVPPAVIPRALLLLLRFTPFPGRSWVKNFLTEYLYVHHGDMRFLTRAKRTDDGRYPDVRVLLNPPMVDRFSWFLRDVSQRLFAPINDHAIDVYYEKLMSYAMNRNSGH